MENRWKVPGTVFSHASVTFLVLPPVLLRCSGRSVPTERRAVSPTTGSFSQALSSAAPRHQLSWLVLGPRPGCPHVKHRGAFMGDSASLFWPRWFQGDAWKKQENQWAPELGSRWEKSLTPLGYDGIQNMSHPEANASAVLCLEVGPKKWPSTGLRRKFGGGRWRKTERWPPPWDGKETG